jgi:hypothetical protein
MAPNPVAGGIRRGFNESKKQKYNEGNTSSQTTAM